MVAGEPLNLFQKARKKVGSDCVALGGYMGGWYLLKGLYWGYIGIMEKKMETTV